MKSWFNTVRLLLIGFVLMGLGCGFKELPGLKTEADKSFKSVLLEYRLRADLVPHFMKLIEHRKEAAFSALHSQLAKAHADAVGVDMPAEKFDERQINRLASFQYALSSELVKMKEVMDRDPQLAKNGEYQSLKEQLGRAEARIAAARQKFMVDGPNLNARLSKIPEKWFNSWLYKYEPVPALQ